MSTYMSSSQAEQALVELWTTDINADAILLDESESIHERTERRGDYFEEVDNAEERSRG